MQILGNIFNAIIFVSAIGKRFVKGVFSLPCLNLSCSNICAYI